MNNGKVESSKNAQSLTYDVRFLVVDGDSTCLTLASRMLRRRGYKVMTAKRAKDALCIIRDREDEIDLVLTESHLPDMDTYKLLETIGEVSSLPVIIMSSDNDENAMLGGLFKGAVFYLVKPIIMNDMKNLWQFAYMNYREKMADLEGINSFQEDSPDENSSDDKSEGQSLTKNGKRKEPEPGENDKDEEEDNDSGVTKKSKLIWTNELHNRFLQAVRVLGFDSAHPKKILEHMNVKGLKKENVSSHLQKYRLTLKRELDAIDITANRNSVQSTLALYEPSSSTFNLKGGISQVPKLQSAPLTCQSEIGSHFQKNPSTFGSCHSFNHVDSNGKCGQFTMSSNQQYLPSSSNVGTTIGSSNGDLTSFYHMGNYLTEDFIKTRLDFFDVEKSGFENATPFLTLDNAIQLSSSSPTPLPSSSPEQQQLQNLSVPQSPPPRPPPPPEQQQLQNPSPQPSPLPPPPQPQEREQNGHFEAGRGEADEMSELEKVCTQLLNDENFIDFW